MLLNLKLSLAKLTKTRKCDLILAIDEGYKYSLSLVNTINKLIVEYNIIKLVLSALLLHMYSFHQGPSIYIRRALKKYEIFDIWPNCR